MAQIDDLRAALANLTVSRDRMLAHIDALNAHIDDLESRLNSPATPAVEPVDLTDVINEVNAMANDLAARVPA